MSKQTLVSVVVSNGRTIRPIPLNRPVVPIVPIAHNSGKSITRKVLAYFGRLGDSFMSWQQVTVIAILVIGGCVLGAIGKETLAGILLGAAAGFISQPLMHKRSAEVEGKTHQKHLLKQTGEHPSIT
jgi:hypothetical protein